MDHPFKMLRHTACGGYVHSLEKATFSSQPESYKVWKVEMLDGVPFRVPWAAEYQCRIVLSEAPPGE